MKRVKNFTDAAVVRGIVLKSKFASVLTKKRDGVDGLMVAIALIVIGVLMAIIFQKSMTGALNNLLNGAENRLNGILNMSV